MKIREARDEDALTLARGMRPAFRHDFEKKCGPEGVPESMRLYLERFSHKWVMTDENDDHPVVLVAVNRADRYKIDWGFIWLAASDEIERRVRDFLRTSDRMLDIVFESFPAAPGLFTWVDPDNPKSVNYLLRCLHFKTGVTVQDEDGKPSLEMMLLREDWVNRPSAARRSRPRTAHTCPCAARRPAAGRSPGNARETSGATPAIADSTTCTAATG